MKKIKELIVVEGKHDKDKLERLVDADIICTNGLALNQQQLDIIEKAAESRGVIVMTDPDYPGKKIRDMINSRVKSAKQVFIPKEKAIGKRNVGIEYVDDDILIEFLNKTVTFDMNHEETINYKQYLKLGLINNKIKRDYVCSRLNIGPCNNKKMLKYLNMLGYDFETVKKEADNYDRKYCSDDKDIK